MEEAPLEEEDEVFYIFYEDKKPEASYEAPTYQSPPTQVNTPHSVQALLLTLIIYLVTSLIFSTFFYFRMIFHHTLLKMYKPPKPHQAITSLMHQIQMILGRCMFLLKVQSIFQIHMMLGKLCDQIIC